MKTALDWLIEQMPYEFRANHTQEIFRQAKEKEKEQIEYAHAHRRCLHNKTMDCTIEAYKNAEEYYNQTYNQNK